MASYAKMAALAEVQAEPLPANSAREMTSSGEDHGRTQHHRKRCAYDTSRQLSPCHMLRHDTLLSPRGNCTVAQWFPRVEVNADHTRAGCTADLG